jgi:hypothetical protein
MRNEFDSVVTVPTLDRELGAPRRCCRATAGGRPEIDSTCGSWPCWMSRLAYGATDSRYRRWASVKMVPNASDDLPDPETPVNATIRSRGMSTSTERRLFSFAPRTRTNESGAFSEGEGIVASVSATSDIALGAVQERMPRHPFVASSMPLVARHPLPLLDPCARFLAWGNAMMRTPRRTP